MSEERRQFDVLVRHFFGGFLDNDLVSPASDLHGPLSKVVAVIALVGVLYPFKLLFRYGRPFRVYAELDLISWGDKCTFVMLSLVVMGLLTVLEWDALQLDRRDCLALGALPIRSRTVLWAKLAALGKFALVLSVPLTLLGAMTFPLIMHAGWSAGWWQAVRTMFAHVAATLAAAWFAFSCLLAAHSVLQCLFGQRLARRLAAGVQLVSTLGLVVALLMLPFIASSTAALKRTAAGIGGFAPQMWFMGIYQTTAGLDDPDWRLLAVRGWTALIVTVMVAVAASVVAYRRVLGTTLEAVQSGASGRSWIIRVADLMARLVARHPIERGFFSFTVLTLLRSPWHRVVLAVFFGVALALSMVALDFATFARDGVHRVPMLASHALVMQFVILVIVLAGVRVAASAPAELRANWVLRLVESGQPRRWMAGFRKAVFAALVVPVMCAMAIATAAQYDWRTAWASGLAALAFALVTFEVLFLGFGRVPFACPFDSGSGDPKVRGLVLVGVFSVVVVPAAELVTLAMRSVTGSTIAVVCGAAAIGVLRWRGNLAITRGGGLAFEPDDESTQRLSLGP